VFVRDTPRTAGILRTFAKKKFARWRRRACGVRARHAHTVLVARHYLT